MTLRNIFFSILCLLISTISSIYAQEDPRETLKTQEQQYEEYITGALKLQVQADSLTRLANQKRRELAFLTDASGKREMESKVLSLENESFLVQRKADSLYTMARAIELRIIANQKEGGGSVTSSPLFNPLPRTAGNSVDPAPEQSFLLLGGINISPGLRTQDMDKAKNLEGHFIVANDLMVEVSEITDEIEQLGSILDSNPRRRERRRINRRIDELTKQSFNKKMEAMVIYKDVNHMRFLAATGYLEQRRNQLHDSLVIKSGFAHEELGKEGFMHASGLRETAAAMRSDKYREGYILRAYTEELDAFVQMEKALEIYNTPPALIRQTQSEVPLRADGRIDPGLALARSRAAARDIPAGNNLPRETAGTLKTGSQVDFGFTVQRESPYSDSNPIPLNVIFPPGIVYTIQLGVYNMMMTSATFGRLWPVMADREAGSNSIRYYAGVFRTAAEAEKALVEVNRQGFTDAFLIGYNDGVKIPVLRARQMESSRQSQSTGNVQAPVPAVTPSPAGAASIVVFRIQLGAFRELLQPDIHRSWQNMAGGNNLEYTINNNGLYVYTLGNFNTFEEALQVRNLVREQGIPDAFIVPFKGNSRISMEEANELLRKR
jgi:hypothetical protein